MRLHKGPPFLINERRRGDVYEYWYLYECQSVIRQLMSYIWTNCCHRIYRQHISYVVFQVISAKIYRYVDISYELEVEICLWRNSRWYRYLFTNFYFKYIWHLFLFLYYYMNEQKVHFQNCKQAYQISYALSTVSFYSYRSICYCSIWCQKLWKLASRIWNF